MQKADLSLAVHSLSSGNAERRSSARLLARIATWLKPGGQFAASVGAEASTGTEDDWLEVRGASMYWSHADAATYRAWLGELGLKVVAEEFVPEGNSGHMFFHARKSAG